ARLRARCAGPLVVAPVAAAGTTIVLPLGKLAAGFVELTVAVIALSAVPPSLCSVTVSVPVSPLSSTPSLSQDDTSSVSAAPLNVRNGNSHTPRPYDPIRKKLPSGGMYKSFTNALESPVPYGFHVAPPSVERKTPSRLAAISVCFVASRGSTITRFTGTSASPPSARLHVAPPSMLFAMRGKPAWGVTDVTYI